MILAELVVFLRQTYQISIIGMIRRELVFFDQSVGDRATNQAAENKTKSRAGDSDFGSFGNAVTFSEGRRPGDGGAMAATESDGVT